MADRKPSPLYDKPDEDEARARGIEDLKQQLNNQQVMKKKKSPLYGKGRHEWEAQPSGRDDESSAEPVPSASDEVERKLGQFRANVGRDASPKWRSIKTVGVRA